MLDNKRVEEKLEKIHKDTRNASLSVIFNSFAYLFVAFIPTTVITFMFDLAKTPFSTVAGLITVTIIQIKYSNPNIERINKEHDLKIQEVMNEIKDQD